MKPDEPTDARWTNSLGMQFRLIPAGEFVMGSTEESDEQPVHHVRITRGFYLGIHQVTQAAYRAVTGKNPSHFKGDDRPVEQVSWDDAAEYCRLLTKAEGKSGVLPAGAEYRLPTEAEWEYACRVGSTGRYCFGDSDAQLAEYAWYDENSGSATHPVGQKKPNAWGLYDMHGNVWEWCQDWSDAYSSGVATDPKGPTSGSARVSRGGGWSLNAGYCRTASRDWDVPSYRDYDLGFRLARSVP
ncbi:MAG: formylglycine-generating enzyme family protein [Planctomycetes bacterium]|nr:formylglycine-generating enzyme family protein [Planctomycetota bacterium]